MCVATKLPPQTIRVCVEKLWRGSVHCREFRFFRMSVCELFIACQNNYLFVSLNKYTNALHLWVVLCFMSVCDKALPPLSAADKHQLSLQAIQANIFSSVDKQWRSVWVLFNAKKIWIQAVLFLGIECGDSQFHLNLNLKGNNSAYSCCLVIKWHFTKKRQFKYRFHIRFLYKKMFSKLLVTKKLMTPIYLRSLQSSNRVWAKRGWINDDSIWFVG